MAVDADIIVEGANGRTAGAASHLFAELDIPVIPAIVALSRVAEAHDARGLWP